jgi:hypothetical protein
VGVLQIATNSSKLTYLRLFGKAISGYFFGYSLIIFSTMLFFLSRERNIDDSSGGLDGNEQIVAVNKKEPKAETTNRIACSLPSSPPDESSIFLSLLRKKSIVENIIRLYPKK